MHKLFAFALSLISLCGAALADAPAALTSVETRETVDAVAARIADSYVFSQKRETIVAAIEKSKAEGRYDVAAPSELAALLTDDMRAASDDGHMYIVWDPAEYESRLVAPQGEEANDFLAAQARRDNQGFTEMRILPGNLRYARWSGAHWNGAVTEQAMADVARFLSGADAIIIDMRNNGGGSAEAVKTFISYFMQPENQLLMTFHDSAARKVDRSRVIGKLAGPRLVGKPLYVLTSGGTASAGEEFVYHVQQFKLGVLIGETTAGGANNNSLYPIAPGFVLSVSTGFPEHPVSGANWEQVGIAPDVKTASPDALAEAKILALRALIANGDERRREQYEIEMATAEAELRPTRLEAEALGEYAGDYDARKIWLEDGVLKYQREGRDATELKPLAADLFTLASDDSLRILFRRVDGKIVGFTMFASGGPSLEVNKRT